MKLLDNYNISELSKIIFKTNIMPSGNNQSFARLGEKLILNLQKGYDFDKMKRVLSSELITTYGLSINDNELNEITERVNSWYYN